MKNNINNYLHTKLKDYFPDFRADFSVTDISAFCKLFEGDKEVGCIDAFTYDISGMDRRNKRNAIHIKFLYVKPEYRKRGIGGNLVKWILDVAEKRKYKMVSTHPVASTLNVIDNGLNQDELEAFYHKFSYKVGWWIFKKEKRIEFYTVVD